MASFERLLPLLSCLAFLLQGATALSLPANHAGVTRRALLLGASTGAAASLIGAPVRADEEAPTSIAYADLVRELKTCRDGAICRVSKVAFTTASGETGDAILANGARLQIVGSAPRMRSILDLAHALLLTDECVRFLSLLGSPRRRPVERLIALQAGGQVPRREGPVHVSIHRIPRQVPQVVSTVCLRCGPAALRPRPWPRLPRSTVCACVAVGAPHPTHPHFREAPLGPPGASTPRRGVLESVAVGSQVWTVRGNDPPPAARPRD